jgi:hypothetical protein
MLKYDKGRRGRFVLLAAPSEHIMNSQFVQIALPIVITLIVAVFAQLFSQNRAFDMLGKNLEMVNRRVDDMRDVLRAEMGGLRAEMAKNQSELLTKLADVENRLDRRLEKLETERWKP